MGAHEGRALAVAMVHYRAERNLSQEELAGLTGVTAAQVSGLEAGDANPSAKTLITISARLGIEPGASR